MHWQNQLQPNITNALMQQLINQAMSHLRDDGSFKYNVSYE